MVGSQDSNLQKFRDEVDTSKAWSPQIERIVVERVGSGFLGDSEPIRQSLEKSFGKLDGPKHLPH